MASGEATNVATVAKGFGGMPKGANVVVAGVAAISRDVASRVAAPLVDAVAVTTGVAAVSTGVAAVSTGVADPATSVAADPATGVATVPATDVTTPVAAPATDVAVVADDDEVGSPSTTVATGIISNSPCLFTRRCSLRNS